MTSIETNQNSTSDATLDEKYSDTNKNSSKDNNFNDANKTLADLKLNHSDFELENLNVSNSSDQTVNNENIDDDDNLNSKLNDEDGNLIDLTELHNDINRITNKLINLNDCLVTNDFLNIDKVIKILF